MRQLADELGAGPPSRRVTGIVIAGFTVQTELPPEQQPGWRQLGEQLLGLLNDQQTGLLITLDEIHGANRDELRSWQPLSSISFGPDCRGPGIRRTARPSRTC
ncbi:hypothetical protein [Arthrobacter crystallopoietes]|uniref:hypothetical protein n=1 Tax=Crystallibacter crystallopoietes TaxID=37928 RepID=UPI001FCDF8CD|nr:hypothetical protein [Arthrobacter crystallopoietes]